MFGFVCYKVIQVLCMFLTFFEVCMTLRKLNFFSQMLFISLLSNIWLVFLHRDELWRKIVHHPPLEILNLEEETHMRGGDGDT